MGRATKAEGEREKLRRELAATRLLLRLLACGGAQFDPSTRELRFRGLRFWTKDKPVDWVRVADVMGWGNIAVEIGQREGGGE